MTILAGDIIRATVNLTLPGPNLHQNILWYRAGAGANQSEAVVVAELGTAIDNAYSLLNSELANDVNGETVEFAVSKNNGASFDDIGFQSMTAFAPTNAVDMLPHGIAAVIRFGGVGVGEQSRLFIGGLAENSQSASDLVGGTITNLVTFALAIDNDVPVTSAPMESGWFSFTNSTFRLFSGTITVNTVLGYQRRRKPGIGA